VSRTLEHRAVIDIARDVRAAGGRALIVGGWVRDRFWGRPNKDIDVEVFGITAERLKELLATRGRVDSVGASFGVFRVSGLDVDFSLPRRERNVGPGHRGFDVATDPTMTVEQAARRRDFTINAMSFDPLTEEVIDPTGGRSDLRDRVLRAVDPGTFGDDPLRAVRGAQFAARFELSPAPALLPILAAQDLDELAGERLFEEFRKLLLRGVRPSLGLNLLRDAGLLRFFPEIEALAGVPQSPEWHPEGDVYVHTAMALDVAAELRIGDDDEDLALMFGVLCHDFGKPGTTRFLDSEERIISRGHEAAGEAPTRAFLGRMRAPLRLIERVVCLVREHLAPMLLGASEAGAPAYRRLARRLAAHGVSMQLLERSARADAWGRTTREALDRTFIHGDRFLAMTAALGVPREGPRDVVLGRHLIARGLDPGPHFRDILAACRDHQDETGELDPQRILDTVLAERP
jgi:tRNA nucleotidyltransferase (CCA-adding enzyme)